MENESSEEDILRMRESLSRAWEFLLKNSRKSEIGKQIINFMQVESLAFKLSILIDYRRQNKLSAKNSDWLDYLLATLNQNSRWREMVTDLARRSAEEVDPAYLTRYTNTITQSIDFLSCELNTHVEQGIETAILMKEPRIRPVHVFIDYEAFLATLEQAVGDIVPPGLVWSSIKDSFETYESFCAFINAHPIENWIYEDRRTYSVRLRSSHIRAALREAGIKIRQG